MALGGGCPESKGIDSWGRFLFPPETPGFEEAAFTLDGLDRVRNRGWNIVTELD